LPHPSTKPAKKPELTKPHGRSVRLTSAGAPRYKRRLAQLCKTGTPGPEITKRLNQEFELNWTLQAHFQRAKDHGLSWPSAQRKGRRVAPAEYLPENQRESCYQDPAWEARNNWLDRLVCRECFVIMRDGTMHGARHLQSMHGLTLEQYRLRHPKAPIFTIERIAKQTEVDVQQHMREIVDSYATPEELAAAGADPKYEAHNLVEKYVICRIARCGFKATSGVPKHLRNAHGVSGKEAVEAYRRDHGWPQIYSRRELSRSSAHQSERMATLKTEARLAGEAKKIELLKSLKGRWKEDKEKIGMALILDPNLSNAEAQKRASREIPIKEMKRLRDLLGIHLRKGWQKGQPRKNVPRTEAGRFRRQ
jgi:hypothetical protein